MPDDPVSWSASERALFAGQASLTLHVGDDLTGNGQANHTVGKPYR
jgi:hypothetical protein